MASSYKSAIRQNPGRKYLVIEFRHPLRPDPSNGGKPGRKVRKGVGTENRNEADLLAAELDQLLADTELHSPAARSKAETKFDRRIVEIFYDGIEPKRPAYRALRDEYLPLPPRAEFPRVLLLGVPGAAKTTLLRQLIGSHPENDRFPSTSVNRTTTCETEVVVGAAEFAAAVTFMSEEEADFEIRQSLSGAVLRATSSNSEADVANVLLERSDMRFRLKYILGDWPNADDDADPYEMSDEPSPEEEEEAAGEVEPTNIDELNTNLRNYLDRLKEIAQKSRQEVESWQGSLEGLSADERSVALDWIQELAEQSEEFAALASDILDDIRSRFAEIPGDRLKKTTTGWPRLWHLSLPPTQREKFITEVRFFSGIDRRQWGKLLSPLVNGMRVAGPFAPEWAPPGPKPQMVLIDTEGLGHKANTMPDIPDYIVSRFQECDLILLVHRGDVPFSFESGKALEAIGAAGQTAKTALVFSRMDGVKGDNIKGWNAKKDYVFSGVRNVLENQISKSLTPDVGRFMATHFERSAFYLGSLQEASPRAAIRDLRLLLTHILAAVPPLKPEHMFPEYSFDLLVLSLQAGVEGFRLPWRAYLNWGRHNDLRPLPWQSIKAMSRRYAEGFDDGYEIRPVSNLLHSMTLAIGRFLENPLRWHGEPTQEEKRTLIDLIKAQLSQDLATFCAHLLRIQPQKQWQEAYACHGRGSTLERRMKIEALYERWVPIPTAERTDSEHVQELLAEMKHLVRASIAAAEKSLEPALTAPATD